MTGPRPVIATEISLQSVTADVAPMATAGFLREEILLGVVALPFRRRERRGADATALERRDRWPRSPIGTPRGGESPSCSEVEAAGACLLPQICFTCSEKGAAALQARRPPVEE